MSHHTFETERCGLFSRISFALNAFTPIRVTPVASSVAAKVADEMSIVPTEAARMRDLRIIVSLIVLTDWVEG